VRQHHRKFLTIKRGGTVEKTSLEEIEIDVADPRVSSPEEETIERQEEQLLQHGLNSLPHHLREVIELRYQKGFKYKEIATELGIPEGSVGALIQRALLEMKQILSPDIA
jgi:RNA polymerase sigma factor (sigma-70 family)